MRFYQIGVAVICFLIIQLSYFHASAQNENQQISVSFNVSKITGDTRENDRFFNSYFIAGEYQKKIMSNINFLINLSFLSAIEETGGGDSVPPTNRALNRYLKNFVTINPGFEIFPINQPSFEMGFGMGPSIRRAREVNPFMASQLSGQEVWVRNRYENRWDFGLFFFLEFNRPLNNNWLIGGRGQMSTYGEGDSDSVFSVSIALGKSF